MCTRLCAALKGVDEVVFCGFGFVLVCVSGRHWLPVLSGNQASGARLRAIVRVDIPTYTARLLESAPITC